MGVPKEDLHRLIDALPEHKISKVKRFLEKLIAEKPANNLRPISEHLVSPVYDDELESDEEIVAAEKGRQDIDAEQVHDIKDVARKLEICLNE